jgi:tight adherence protein C
MMPALPPTGTMLLAAAAGLAAMLLAVLAAAIMGRAAEERDVAGRLRSVVRPADRQATRQGASVLGLALLQPLLRLGEVLRDSAIVSHKEIAEFQRALAAAGLNPRRAVPTFIGAKAALIVVLPTLALLAVLIFPFSLMKAILTIFGALVVAVLGPNWVLGRLRRPFQAQLRRGLPDALDLMVVAAEAGLGLESAVDRVAREMGRTNRAIALEFGLLVQELRLLPDRREALERMAERTDMDGFKQLSTTLIQTTRFGTPLAQALRVLASEMRTERQLRLEEKAIRLPALLIGPLILFILPTLFIALLGPSILEMSRGLGGGNP